VEGLRFVGECTGLGGKQICGTEGKGKGSCFLKGGDDFSEGVPRGGRCRSESMFLAGGGRLILDRE